MSDLIEDTYLPVTMLSKRKLHQGFRTVTQYDYREEGSELIIRRELVDGRHAVAIIAFDEERDLLVMIRQFRLGAQLGTGFGQTVEVPAGMIDPGEEPIETARRELREETGLEASTVKPACTFLTTPGVTDEVLHLFYARIDSTQLSKEAGVEGESEQTFPFTLTLDEALNAMDENRIHNGIVMLALMWFARHKQQLIG